MTDKKYNNIEYKNILKQRINNIIIGKKYKIKGTFLKNNKFVDVDVSNFVNPDISNKIKKVLNDLPDDIKFVDMTSIDNNEILNQPWKITSSVDIENYNYDIAKKYLDNLLGKNIINMNEYNDLINKINKKPNISDIAHIDKFIYFKRKIRWTYDDIMKGNKKTYRGEILLSDVLKYSGNVMHYIFLGNNTYMPYDIALVSNKHIPINLYNASKYNKYIWNEYYYIACDIKKKLWGKPQYNELRELTGDKYIEYRKIIITLFYLKRIIRNKIINDNNLEIVINNIIGRIRKINVCIDPSKWDSGNLLESNIIEKTEEKVFDKLNKIFEEIVNKYLPYIDNKI